MADLDEGLSSAELARGFEGAFRAASMGNFSSWTDADLYRAIASEPEGPGQEQAIEEYVAELKAREAKNANLADLVERLREKYRL